MNRLLIKPLLIITIYLATSMLLAFAASNNSLAAEIPVGWPWHGVSMHNLSSSPSDIERFHDELDLDFVRLQLKPAKLSKRRHLTSAAAWKESMAWLDDMLDECQRLEIQAIVNLSYFPIDPAYNPNPNISVAQYTPEFWDDPEQLNGVVQTVLRLMKHLRKRGAEFAAIDIMSEPGMREGARLVAPKKWAELMSKVIAAIRTERPDIWVLLSPPPQGKASSYHGFEPFMKNRVIYNSHIYTPSAFAAQGIGGKKLGSKYPGNTLGKRWDAVELKNALKPLRDFQNKNDVPVMIGEFSAVRWAEGSEQYIKDLASIFDEYGWGWAYFSANGWHGWNPDYNQQYPGKDTGAWKKNYVGDRSERWKTLRKVFAGKQKRIVP